MISENENYKKTRRGIRYIDADIIQSMIEKKDNNSNDFDDEDDDSDDNEDEQFDAERNNIDNNGEDQNFENYEEKDIPEIVNSELSQEYNLEYLKYQHDLYSEIYGLNTIDSENIQQFKDNLEVFETKRIAILNVYLFAKSCNISQNHGDKLLKLIKNIYPNVEVPQHIPDSWKSVSRAINRQASYYTCEKMTIPFPEHWEMNKWNCNNAPAPEKVEIRIRDPIELIADQCVNPIIHFLWKDYVQIHYHEKTNSKNEKVYCDIMSSEWARKNLEDIRKTDPNGLLLPIILYADGVSIGMNGKANVAPAMMTLG